MTRRVRTSALTNYIEVARSAGLDPYRLARDAGLGRASLDHPDLKVPADRVAELLEASAAASGVEAFGLLMVEGRRISNLGVLGLLTREEPTLRAALTSTGRYGRVQNESLVQQIDEADGIAVISEELLTRREVPARQAIEMVVGVVVRLIRVFLGADWKARRICFRHPEPGQLSIHRRVLGQTPEFNCDFNGIVCTSADLDTPIATADPVIAGYLRQQFNVDAMAAPSVEDEVRQMIMVLMPRGHCTAEQIAQLMGINRRTLHRRLALENRRYADLLQEIRRELAQRYVTERGRTLADVSQMLGFGELSSFSRWHRGTFGVTAEKSRPARPAVRAGAAGRGAGPAP